jgi:hypothetical protein
MTRNIQKHQRDAKRSITSKTSKDIKKHSKHTCSKHPKSKFLANKNENFCRILENLAVPSVGFKGESCGSAFMLEPFHFMGELLLCISVWLLGLNSFQGGNNVFWISIWIYSLDLTVYGFIQKYMELLKRRIPKPPF